MSEKDKKPILGFQITGPYSVRGIEQDGIRPEISTVELERTYPGKLAFDRQGRIYVLDLQTGELQTFRGIRAAERSDWHPDGQHLAFGGSNIYILNVQTGKFVNTTNANSGRHAEPSWSPDGKRIVYIRGQELWIMDVEKKSSTPIRIKGSHSLHYPAWSPDGKQIAFLLIDKPVGQIYCLDVESIDENYCPIRQLTARQGASTQPSWSPDSRYIVFRSEKGIFVMNADGSNQHQLTESKRGDFQPCWSPDGKYIVFNRHSDNAQSYLHIMKSDGSEVTPVAKGLKGLHPAWWMDLGNKGAK